MTSRATSQNVRVLNLILRFQSHAVCDLALGFVLNAPRHVKDFVDGTDKALRLAMTFETPLHLQTLRLKRNGHFVHAPVTGRAANALLYVNCVIEIGVVGQVVDANPFDRLAGPETRAHWFQIRTIGPDLFMTTHAGAGRWQTR